MASVRKDLKYRRYRILAAQVGGTCRAIAYAGNRKIAAIEGETQEAAVDALKIVLDTRDRDQFRARRDGVPTAEEYREAFQAIAQSITKAQLAMLKAHYHATADRNLANVPDRTLGTEELALAAGYPNHTTVNLQYGKLGRRLAEYLNYSPPNSELRGDEVWTLTLATGQKFAGAGLWIWTMRPEVADALRDLDIV